MATQPFNLYMYTQTERIATVAYLFFQFIFLCFLGVRLRSGIRTFDPDHQFPRAILYPLTTSIASALISAVMLIIFILASLTNIIGPMASPTFCAMGIAFNIPHMICYVAVSIFLTTRVSQVFKGSALEISRPAMTFLYVCQGVIAVYAQGFGVLVYCVPSGYMSGTVGTLVTVGSSMVVLYMWIILALYVRGLCQLSNMRHSTDALQRSQQDKLHNLAVKQTILTTTATVSTTILPLLFGTPVFLMFFSADLAVNCACLYLSFTFGNDLYGYFCGRCHRMCFGAHQQITRGVDKMISVTTDHELGTPPPPTVRTPPSTTNYSIAR